MCIACKLIKDNDIECCNIDTIKEKFLCLIPDYMEVDIVKSISKKITSSN